MQAVPSAVSAKTLRVAHDMKETKARIMNNVIVSPPVNDEFIAYLHEFFSLEDITWLRAEYVTGILDWNLKVEAVFQSLKEKGWAKGSQGGFRVLAGTWICSELKFTYHYYYLRSSSLRYTGVCVQ